MEHKRNRAAVYRKRRRSRGGSSGMAVSRALLALILVAGIIYLLSASAAGTWIAQNVVAPIFEVFNKNGGNTDTDANNDSDGSIAVNLPGDKSAVTADVTLPAISLYTLQMGAYSSRDNASAQADRLKAQGAAGYVLKDGDRYRVISASYTGADDAKSVKDRLVDEGTDCTIFTLACDEAVFRVSAEESNLSSIRSGFSALYSSQAKLSEAILEFDSESQSIQEGKAAADAILTSLKEDMNLLVENRDSLSSIKSLLNCYDEYCLLLASLSDSSASGIVDFSSQMKYAQISMAAMYVELSDSLTASI